MESSFDITAGRSCKKGKKNCSMSKIAEKLYLSTLYAFLQIVLLDIKIAVLDRTAGKICPNRNENIAQSPIYQKNWIFFLLIMSPQVFIWTRRMQSWQPCQKNFAKRPQILHSEFKNDRESYNLFRKKVFSKKSSRHAECKVVNLDEIFDAMVKKMCEHVIHQCWSFFLFFQNVFLKSFSPNVERSFYKLVESFFSQNKKWLRSKSIMFYKNFTHWKYLQEKRSSAKLECISDDPVGEKLSKVCKIFLQSSKTTKFTVF